MPWTAKKTLCRLFLQLFNLIAVLDLIDKDFRRLEAGNKMFIDDQCGVPGDVTSNLFLALLVDKASKPADIDVISVRH